METYAIGVTIVAIILGVGWWIDHRGIAGIKSDLADAQNDAAKLRAKVKR